MKPSGANHSSDSNSEQEAERFVPGRDGPELAYEHVHRYLLAAKLLKGLRVLDLAAGSGYGTLLMEQAGCRMTTLDLDPKSLRKNHSGVCANAQELPFRDGSFDAVVCFEAIEHVKNAEALVQEVRRALGGPSIFLVSTPDRTIYSDRAGHRNPYHVTEMDRTEFTALLKRSFEYVRLSGQGLWAGSWITSLDEDESESALQQRKVNATRWKPDFESSSSTPAKWAAPEKDELPVPVYLLAACSNSMKGWNSINQQLSTDSVLHDSSQWLLAQYERLVEEGTGRNEELECQIDRARLAQRDLLEQLRTARATIDEQATRLVAARSSMSLLEQETERARESIDHNHQRLQAAESGAKDMESQIEAARSAHVDLQTQLEAARGGAADMEGQIENARTLFEDKEREIDVARHAAQAQEIEIERLEAETTVAFARIKHLDRANARRWSRIGHRIADWLSKWSGDSA